MSLANQITLARLLLAVVLFVLLVWIDPHGANGGAWLLSAMVLFIIIVATDALDGYYARKYQQVSDFGRVADPAVDKIVVCGTLILLTATDWARELLAPWMVVLIVSREFAISSLRGYIESRGIRFGADWPGKLKMIVQSIAIPTLFFSQVMKAFFADIDWVIEGSRALALVFIWAAIVLTVYSGLDYVRKAVRLLRVPS